VLLCETKRPAVVVEELVGRSSVANELDSEHRVVRPRNVRAVRELNAFGRQVTVHGYGVGLGVAEVQVSKTGNRACRVGHSVPCSSGGRVEYCFVPEKSQRSPRKIADLSLGRLSKEPRNIPKNGNSVNPVKICKIRSFPIFLTSFMNYVNLSNYKNQAIRPFTRKEAISCPRITLRHRRQTIAWNPPRLHLTLESFRERHLYR